MKRIFYRYKYRKAIGVILGIAGFLIIMSVVPVIETLLIVVGGILIVMGFLILK